MLHASVLVNLCDMNESFVLNVLNVCVECVALVSRQPAHTNEDVANVATVYVAPLSLLLHLCLASYFYTVLYVTYLPL